VLPWGWQSESTRRYPNPTPRQRHRHPHHHHRAGTRLRTRPTQQSLSGLVPCALTSQQTSPVRVVTGLRTQPPPLRGWSVISRRVVPRWSCGMCPVRLSRSAGVSHRMCAPQRKGTGGHLHSHPLARRTHTRHSVPVSTGTRTRTRRPQAVIAWRTPMPNPEPVPQLPGWECWCVPHHWPTFHRSWHARPVGAPIAVIDASTRDGLIPAAQEWLNRPVDVVDAIICDLRARHDAMPEHWRAAREHMLRRIETELVGLLSQ
jgi:hypothetical protein